jgi:hypothetical protein
MHMNQFVFLLFFILYSFLVAKAQNTGKECLEIAKSKADKSIIDLLGLELFQKNVKWNIKGSYVNCTTESGIKLFMFSDDFNYIPRIYRLDYYIVQNDDTLLQFDMQSDSIINFDLKTDSYWYYTLIAYKKMLSGEFKISKAKALLIGDRNNVSGPHIKAQLQYDSINTYNYSESKFFWKVEPPNCKKCTVLHVNPVTGAILGKYEQQLIIIE